MLPDLSSSDNAAVLTEIQDRECPSAMLKQNLARAQLRMKHQADSKRTAREFCVGDKVYLKLQPYVQQSVVMRPSAKLSYKFFGPYEILACIGPTAYKLQLPEGSLIHHVFHVSQLKPHVPDHTPVFVDLPKPLEMDTVELFPQEVLDRCLVKKGNAAYLQVFIKWSALPPEMATWEDYKVLRKRYPDATAWGQAVSQAGGNVMTSMDASSHKNKQAEKVINNSGHASTVEWDPTASG